MAHHDATDYHDASDWLTAFFPALSNEFSEPQANPPAESEQSADKSAGHNQDGPAQTELGPVLEVEAYVDFEDWLNNLDPIQGSYPIAPGLSLQTFPNAGDFQNSETLRSETLHGSLSVGHSQSDFLGENWFDGVDGLFPIMNTETSVENPSMFAPQAAEKNWEETATYHQPDQLVAQIAHTTHTKQPEQLPTQTNVTDDCDPQTSYARQTEQPPNQANVTSDCDPDTHGRGWKPVNRKSLLPGCAVFDPNERKRQREPSPQSNLAPKRANKTRRKAGNVCARCKFHREGCSGNFPCERCIESDKWSSICVRARLCEGVISETGLYLARVKIMKTNVRRWHPVKTHPLIELKVGIGFLSTLSIEVDAFEAIDAKLLEHVNFRSSTSAFLRTTETKPFALRSFTIRPTALDDFFDQHLPHLLDDQFNKSTDGFSKQVFQTAYRFSLDQEKPEAKLLKNVLQMWASQTVFFGRIWRLSQGGEHVGAIMHPGMGAHDVPRFLYWQLDCVAEDYAFQKERSILGELESFIFARKKAPWLAIVLASYIYLNVLERDTWNIMSWKAKSDRWATDPRVANNPTMVWPLPDKPEKLVERNEAKARVIISHVRTISRGEAPFYKDVHGIVKANTGNTPEINDFTAAIQDDFDALSQHLLLSGSCSFSDDDWNSLDYKFSGMVIDASN